MQHVLFPLFPTVSTFQLLFVEQREGEEVGRMDLRRAEEGKEGGNEGGKKEEERAEGKKEINKGGRKRERQERSYRHAVL